MKQERKTQLTARDQEYAEILKRRQEYEAELDQKAPSEGLGAAKGVGQYWKKRLRQAKPVGKPRKEVNTKPCRRCKAKVGQPCSFLGRTGLVVLTETHATQARKHRAEKQKAAGKTPPPPPDHRPMALDRSYDRRGGSTSAGSQDSLAE